MDGLRKLFRYIYNVEKITVGAVGVGFAIKRPTL